MLSRVYVIMTMREVDYSLRISLIIYSPQKHNGFLIIAAFWDSKSSSCFTPKNFSSFKTHRLHFWWFPFFVILSKLFYPLFFTFLSFFIYFSLIMPRTSSHECNRKILSLFFSSVLHFLMWFFLSFFASSLLLSIFSFNYF